MKLTNFFTLIAFLFGITNLEAQNYEIPNVEMLKSRVHLIDTTARAAYLYHDCQIQFLKSPDNRTVFSFKIKDRIKVYKKEGTNYGEFNIKLYKQPGSKEKLNDVKMKVYNFENGEITMTKLSRKDIYEEEISEYRYKKIFAAPNLKEGSIIDVEYTIVSPFIYTVRQFYFQQRVPVDFAKYEISIPDYLAYTPIPSGLLEVEFDKKRHNVGNQAYTKYILKGTDFSALENDEYVLNVNDYRDGIRYELHSTNFPGQGMKYYSKDWNGVADVINNNEDYRRLLKKNWKECEPLIEYALSLNHDERIDTIYNFVRNNFTWNGYIGKYSDDGIKKFQETKSGNIADINYLLINLLRKAKVDVNPLITRIRDNGLINQTFPSATELDYPIAAVSIPDGSGYRFLDASSKMTPSTELPYNAINFNGLLVKGNKGEIIQIQNPNKSQRVYFQKLTFNEELSLIEGTEDVRLSGIAAKDYRKEHWNDEQNSDEEVVDEDDPEEEEDDDDTEALRTLKDIQNLKQVGKSVSLSYDVAFNSHFRKLKNKIFIDACLDNGIDENPFDEETRSYPVFFPNRSTNQSVISIAIPSGYTIEKMPEKVRYVTPSKSLVYEYDCMEMNGELIVKRKMSLNQDIILPEEYEGFRHLFNLAFDKDNEKIVLVEQ